MTQYFGFIEAGLTLAIVFGIGLWQLRSVNKSIAEDKAKADALRERAASGMAASPAPPD